MNSGSQAPHPDADTPHELEFTSQAASWMNLILEKDPALPFSEARCERRSQGSQQRRDLTLLGRDGGVLVTGEVKLPYQKDGGTPYHRTVVRDARAKAQRAGARFFFTWNVNECVLWDAESGGDRPDAGQSYQSWPVATVTKPSHLTLPATQDAIKQWLGLFLHALGRIVRGHAQVGFKAPDERFIDALESALSLPIRLTFEELTARHAQPRQRAELERWMRDEQGWTLGADPDHVRETLERAAQFAGYALVNKLVFYEALLKRYGAQLHKLTAPAHLETGDALRLHLEGFFADARRVTEDYETVFGADHTAVGNRIPFYADSAVPYWRTLIEQIHEFDFSKLDYEVIGSIFERLISPEERHKYGQFYTRAEVVDLMNSFCIRDGAETVLDPACGGGTFLVRAYARKRELQPGRGHDRLLAELYGVDVSHFATHLTTINLATRDLIQAENYPRVARADFFDVRAHQRFLRLPQRVQSKGLGKIQQRDIEIPPLDAVIGNPPYVRQEDIQSDKPKSGGQPSPGTKEFYRQRVKQESGADLSGRSDLHCYFWPHAATFLKPDGWLCLLTSSQWLDVEYGFRLQSWMLARFKIVAVFESLDEPWFVGARVATTATLLQRCDDSQERADNFARFVQLRRPIGEILAHDGTTAGAVRVADAFRDEILNLTENAGNERYRVRRVRQGELLAEGIRLGQLMRKAGAADEGDNEPEPPDSTLTAGAYYGGKWGIHLRAPDLWFEWLDRFRDRLAPLGEIAEVRRGITSGKDEFFFPRDASADGLGEISDPVTFEQAFGVPRPQVESGAVKLVRCGEGRGEIRPIEARYLEPEVHSLMEVKGYTVRPRDCARLILLVGEPRQALQGTYALKYIEWGEANGWHQGSTCAARANAERGWYDLTGHARGAMFWPMAQQYKHAIARNDHDLIANHNLFDVSDHEGDHDCLAGVLNSSVVVLSKFLFGRPVGVEGNLKTEVVDVKMMLVPNPRTGDISARRRVALAFQALKQRPTLQFLPEQRLRQMAYRKNGREAALAELSDQCELDMADRRELDDAVLELLGVANPRERLELRQCLYAYLREFFEHARQKEEKAIANKNKAKRRSAATPDEIAAQVLADIRDRFGHLLRPYAEFVDLTRPYDTFDLPVQGTAEVHHDLFSDQGGVRFMRGRKQIALVPARSLEQATLVALVATRGARGLVRAPLAADDCARLHRRYQAFLDDRAQRIRQLVEERTGDPELQERVIRAVLARMTGDPDSG
ncbi:MAG: SAM-dependent DNA methyltransferase [Candidatus Contendobacter sp.]|nr:MAG: SAM-dependent DNA methyltransferase [Candidatus Contendobacter sp.]